MSDKALSPDRVSSIALAMLCFAKRMIDSLIDLLTNVFSNIAHFSLG